MAGALAADAAGAGADGMAATGRISGDWLIAALFGLAALALRLFRLGAQSLWLDEGGTWHEVTQRSWGFLLAELWSPRSGYPLYHLLLKGWVALFGDSEIALRLPSALAGALLVPAVYALGARLGGRRLGGLAALLLLANPFALWQAQDAKTYSLVMLVVALSLLSLWEALERGGRRRWLLWIGLLALLLSLHRLALFAVIGQVAALVLAGSLERRTKMIGLLALAALAGGLLLGLTYGLRRDPDAPAVATAIGPLRAAWLVPGRWAFDRSSDDLPLPALLALAALALGCWRAARSRPGRLALVSGGVGVGLFLLVLAGGVPLYEARYFSFALPLWALLVAWGLDWLFGLAAGGPPWLRRAPALAPAALIGLALWALFSRPYGLWSGAAVKEDYRGAMTELARRVTPGDAVVLHPAFLATQAPLYRYYAARVTPDPLPAPLAFGRVGAAGYTWGEFDNDYSALLAGRRRAWLMIAPANAKLVDPPDPRFPQDDMGRVGINFLTADQNDKWRCLDVPYLNFGALRLLCQSFPAPLLPGSLEMGGAWPVPASDTATFGGAIRLDGFALRPWRAGGGALAGGTLPIELALSAAAPISGEYRMFVHLLPEIGAPLAAQYDSAPLGGGLPTTRWRPGQPIHDELAVFIPPATAPGRYKILLGWYDPAIAQTDAQRLPVTAHSGPAGADYVELGSVEVRQP